jgi:hypothetical protein
LKDGGKLDTAAVFEAVFDIFRKQAGLLLPAAVLVYLVPALLDGILRDRGDELDPGVLLVSLLVSVIATIWFQGVVIEAVRDIRDGRRDHTIGSVFRSVRPVIGPLTLAALLIGLGVAAGILLLIVPGLVLLTWWSLAAPVIVLERTSATAALRRSRELVRGHGWRVFGVLIVVILINLVVVSLFQAAAEAISDDITVYSIGVLAGSALTAPLSALAAAVMYLELRRLKGQALEVPPAPTRPL